MLGVSSPFSYPSLLHKIGEFMAWKLRLTKDVLQKEVLRDVILAFLCFSII